MTYEIGVVYVWQNQTGSCAWANGTECVVTAPGRSYISITGQVRYGWPTDTVHPEYPPMCTVMALAGDLRRKQPPSGELSIIRMFDLTAPAPREVEAA